MAETFVVSLEDDVSGAAASAGAAVGMLANTFGSLGKGLGAMGEDIGALGAELGPLAPVAEAAAGAILALGAAAAAMVIKGAQMAIAASEMHEQLVQTFDALGGGSASGQEIIATLDGLRDKLGMTRAELAPLAEQLLALGVPADELDSKLTAIASIKAMGLTGGVEAFTKVLGKLQAGAKVTAKDLLALERSGVDVSAVMHQFGAKSLDDLAKQLAKGKIKAKEFQNALTESAKAQGVAALASKANQLSTIVEQAKENFMQLFEEIGKTEGYQAFVAGVKDMLSVFDQSTASGKALKTILTQAFSAIFSAASKVLPYIKAGFLGIVQFALKIYIALKPAIAAFKQLFSSGDDKSAGFMKAIAAAADLIGPPLARGAMAAAHLAGGFVKAYALISAVWGMITGKVQAGIDAISGIMGGGGNAAGGSLIDGIVSGITGKAGAVYAALSDMASHAIDTLKGALKIGSPSKVTEELGKHTVGGFAGGIDKHSDKVGDAWDGAMSSFGAPPPAAASGGAGGGTQITIDVGGIHIEGGAKGVEEITEEAFKQVLERLMLSQGL